MPQARRLVLPVGSRQTYHVISRCSRRDWLLGRDRSHRKDWAVGLLDQLLGWFSIDLQAYAIMSNHIHLVLRPRPDKLECWGAERVARVGLQAIPVRPGNMVTALPVTVANVSAFASNAKWVEDYRSRLSSLSWFMKLFKQRLARRANREDGCSGHFWESRFQTVPLLDNGAVVACMAYVDLNPTRAGIGRSIGDATHCSIRQRMIAGGLLKADGRDSDEERSLSRRLVPLSACHPVDPRSGEIPRNRLSLDDYLDFMDPQGGRRLIDRYGLEPASWSTRSREPGAFQGVAVGSRGARQVYAAQHGKRSIADKTRVWADGLGRK